MITAMAHRDQLPTGDDTYGRLDRPAGSNAWRISALIVVLVLGGVVVVGRLGMQEPATSLMPSPAATITPPAVAELPSPIPEATLPVTPPPATAAPASAAPASAERLPMRTEAIAGRYADGIPLSVDGERVLRLPNALSLPADTIFLVGGWYLGPDCGGLGHGGSCPRARMANSPSDFARRGGTVDVLQVVAPGSGPRVFRATVEEECRISCRPVLEAWEVVWSGDPLTDAGPIDVVPLLSALNYAFPDMDAAPFGDLPQCPMPWPPQSYRSTAGGPRLTLVFPTAQDRLDAQAAIRAGRSLLLAEQGGECREQAGRSRPSGRWVVEENVMLLVNDDERTIALVEAALHDALSQAAADESAAAGPISVWQALRRLWRFEPTLDVAERLEEAVCGADLPPDTFRLTHPDVRTLAVFASRGERRRFQRSVAPGAIATDSEDCSAVGPAPADEDYRWISSRNVLLEVRGPEWLDEALLEVLTGTGTP